jgi:hypothetical protein
VRVLLLTYGSCGDVEPLVGLAVRLRGPGADVRVCAPPDEEFAQRLDGVAGKPGVRSASVTFQQLTLPSPHRPPPVYRGRPFPPEVSDNRALWDLDAQSIDALFGVALDTNRAAIGLPPVGDVRTDGATLLLDAASWERSPVSA